MAGSCIVLHVCVLSALRHLYSCDLCDTVFFLIRFRTHSRQGRALVFVSEENKKSEPFSYREKVRIFIVWCRWWGSNPHVLLAQGILSFLSASSIWCHPVISSDIWFPLCKGKIHTSTNNILKYPRFFDAFFSLLCFFRFGPPKWKLEGCSGGMQGKTLLCLGTKRKESQG